MNLNLFRHSILTGTVIGIVLVSVLVSVVFLTITSTLTERNARQDVTRHLEQLLETVGDTASVACFVGDSQLANELVAGLMKNEEIAWVSIEADKKELAHAGREGADGRMLAPLVRQVMSPFTAGEVIGSLTVQPDAAVIERAVQHQVRVRVAMLALQLFIIVLAVTGIVLHLIVRPIRALSDSLHRLDAREGEKLLPPRGHEQNEIAVLTNDINTLTDSLVSALREEQAVRMAREKEERKYRSIFENSTSGIFVANAEGSVLSSNQAFQKLGGFVLKEGMALDRLSHLQWCDPEQLQRMLEQCAEHGECQSRVFEIGANGGLWLNVALTSIGDRQVQGVVTDVTQSKQSETLALKMAVSDQLTGASNRLGLERHISEAVAHAPLQSFALLLVDIRGFRQVNESMGMSAGDEILRVAVSRMRGCIKNSDWLARMGGDEFVIVLHGVGTREDAARVAGRINKTLARPAEVLNHPFVIQTNVGIAFYPVDGRDLHSLLRDAGFALAKSKLSGEKGFEFFEVAMIKDAEQRYQLEADLKLSVARNELALHFQPIIELASNRLLGAEALVRWQHPKRGMVMPDTFIPLAEQNGFIREMGVWVLEEACRHLAAWRAANNSSLYMTVNVATPQIPDGLPVELAIEAADRYGVPHDALIFEITEGVLLSDFNKGLKWVESMRAAGFHIYLDDFGTGYSSLSYLKRFPVDAVKVDKSFVRDMQSNASDRALVQAVVAMARALDLQVVAEGVESKQHVELLVEMGCSRGQGYYFSKPMPASAFLEKML